MKREFGDLIDVEGLTASETARLQRVHQMVVAAGPPPELSLALQTAPAAPTARPRSAFRLSPPALRGRSALGVLGATTAFAAACFGVGFVLGDHATGNTQVVNVVAMQGNGTRNTTASLHVGAANPDGNWPLSLTVSGLAKLKDKNSYYVLALEENGKPERFCGMFRVDADGKATVEFSVPYPITKSTRWAVTAMKPGASWPGHVVMTTS